MEKTRNILFWLGQKEEKEILNDEMKHVEISLKCVEEMKNAIESFVKGKKDAIESLIKNDMQKLLEECAHIETLEEEGDDRRRELIRILIKENLSAPKTLLLYEIIDTLENLTDSIKKAGDLVRILGIKSK